MKKRFEIENVMEMIYIIASIMMSLVTLYKSCKNIKRDVMIFVKNRKNNEGS